MNVNKVTAERDHSEIGYSENLSYSTCSERQVLCQIAQCKFMVETELG